MLLTDVPPAVPVRLLEQRPDVRAAARRLDAARYRIGARKAELFPSITISATGGLQSSSVENILDIDQYFTNFVGGLLAPIFAGGRLRANVRVAAAQYEQQVAAFSRTLLTAVKDVETGLVNLANERRRYEVLLEQREDARASLDLQIQRFRQGVGDYVAYLDARTSFVSAERAVSDAERRLTNARVTLHRALGGTWTDTPDDTVLTEEQG
jgi:outer membrane protein TolC